MKEYIIAYDLHDAGSADYGKIEDAISRVDDRAEPVQKSVWIVVTDMSRNSLFHKIDKCIKKKDRLLVAELGKGIKGKNSIYND